VFRNKDDIIRRENLKFIIFCQRDPFHDNTQPNLNSSPKIRLTLQKINSEIPGIVQIIDEKENSFEVLLFLMKYSEVLVQLPHSPELFCNKANIYDLIKKRKPHFTLLSQYANPNSTFTSLKRINIYEPNILQRSITEIY